MLGALLTQHTPATTVAFGARGVRTASDLQRDAARIAAALGAAEPNAQALLFVRDDRYLFAAALLGTLQAGYVPVVATDTSRDTAMVLAPQSRHILHDTLSGAPLRLDLLLSEDADTTETRPVGAPEPSQPIRLQGPDEHGNFACVERTFGQLLLEAEVVGQALDYAPGSPVVSGVPPGHPFGLTLGVLLPLLRGGAMLREVPQSPTALAAALTAWPDAWLACVASQLLGLQREPPGPRPRRVCTTALSDGSLRARSEARLACQVDEVVFDSKLGCVLVRRSGAQPCTPLPGAQATCDPEGRLRVAAPWLPGGDPRCMQASGICVQAESHGGFHYRGRPEERCTLGTHTLCLPELDGALRALSGVDDALWIAPAHGPHAGGLLLAAVAPAMTSRDIERAARALIASRTGAPGPAEPARILLMDSIPRDGLGAPRLPEVLRRFGLTAMGERLRLAVEWLPNRDDGENPRSGRYVAEARVPDDYAYFEGHFPGYPILPGAAQLGELVLPCVRVARPQLGPLTGMSRLKFLGRIQPGNTVRIVVEWTADEPQTDFSVTCEGKICAAGRLVFEPSDEAERAADVKARRSEQR